MVGMRRWEWRALEASEDPAAQELVGIVERAEVMAERHALDQTVQSPVAHISNAWRWRLERRNPRRWSAQVHQAAEEQTAAVLEHLRVRVEVSDDDIAEAIDAAATGSVPQRKRAK